VWLQVAPGSGLRFGSVRADRVRRPTVPYNADQTLTVWRRLASAFGQTIELESFERGLGQSMRVLLVEDHHAMREMISDHLKECGFAMDAASCGEDALAVVAAVRFDAVVLDLGLPDMDGMEMLAALRNSTPDLPAIILTARDSVDNRLLGLNAGADDYIIKPFDLSELEARLRAVLRRPGRRHGITYAAGRVCFDTASREATVNGVPIGLTRREAALLEELLRIPGRVIAKDALEERLYSLDDAGSMNALEAAVSRLRRKLLTAGAGLQIETKWGIGYRLIVSETE
jgi:two-component system, OmpR family, response regulator QseB